MAITQINMTADEPVEDCSSAMQTPQPEPADVRWGKRAETLWRHPVTQQYVDHDIAMADEQHQDEIRGKADWRRPT